MVAMVVGVTVAAIEVEVGVEDCMLIDSLPSASQAMVLM